jgi:PAS domain S-box-containing protein
MQRDGIGNTQIRWPGWIGYAVTMVLEAVLTLVLVLVEPHFPLGQFPIAYVVVIMLVAYLFGEGPAVLALVLGFVSFTYFFVDPRYTLSPAAVSAQGWASLVAYLIGAAIVGLATIMARRSRRRIERLLNEVSRSNQRIQFLIENSPLAVIEWNADYRITRWSEEATRIFGWTAEETIGRRIDELSLVYEEDWESVNEVMADMMSGARPRNVNKNRNRRKDGSVIYCEWYNSALLDPSGNLVSVLSLVLDVTERALADNRSEHGCHRSIRLLA